MASLCVMCKMARLVDSEEAYRRYKDIIDRGSAAFDKLLWNGEFRTHCNCCVAFSVYILRSSPGGFYLGTGLTHTYRVFCSVIKRCIQIHLLITVYGLILKR